MNEKEGNKSSKSSSGCQSSSDLFEIPKTKKYDLL